MYESQIVTLTALDFFQRINEYSKEIVITFNKQPFIKWKDT